MTKMSLYESNHLFGKFLVATTHTNGMSHNFLHLTFANDSYDKLFDGEVLSYTALNHPYLYGELAYPLDINEDIYCLFMPSGGKELRLIMYGFPLRISHIR